MTRTRLFTCIVLALGAAPLVAAPVDDKKEDPNAPRTEPKGLPIELKISNTSLEAYDLDPRGEAVYKFQENIRKAEKSGQPLFATRVEMELEIKNTGKSPIDIWVGGDAVLLTLDLKGNGAMIAQNKTSAEKGTIPPVAITIPPGKSHKIPLRDLADGFRNQARYLYLADIGVYTLSATLRTAVSPAPPKTKELRKGFGEVILKSAPLTFRAVRPS